MTLTIGRLSERFKISRTALLYYDKIGLLSPSSRSASGYRLYEEPEAARLGQIILLKNAGVPLNQIGSLLEAEDGMAFGKLLKRLGEINTEIEKLRNCQRQIIGMLGETVTAKKIGKEGIQTIQRIIGYAGIDFDKKESWHSEFEKQSPEQHKKLLEMLGLNEDEIRKLNGKRSGSDINGSGRESGG